MSLAVEHDLVAWLKAEPAVFALVADRVEPLGSDQGTANPRITYQRIDTDRYNALVGAGVLPHPRIQLDIWADTEIKCRQIGEAIRGTRATPRLDGFAGYLQPTGKKVQACRCVDERADYTPPQDQSSVGEYRLSMDFVIHHED